MKQLRQTLLITALLSLLSLDGFAYDACVNGIYYNFDGDNAIVTYKQKNTITYKGVITIPSSVTYMGKTYNVNEIGAYAFEGSREMTAITIPQSVASIGKNAFDRCMGLAEVTIPMGVTKIEDHVFWRCTNLTSVTIPESVTEIGWGAFSGCESLNNLTLPSNLTIIEQSVFSGCKNLTELIIPDGVTTIESGAFSGCVSLTELIIPDGVTSIGSEAFSGCTSLKNVSLPPNLTVIESYLFSGCSALTNIIIPEGVTSIEQYAFYGCKGLTSVSIPSTFTGTGPHAFEYCNNLSKVIISDIISWNNASINSLYYGNPLYYARHLYLNDEEITDLVIPEGVYGVDNFACCTGLTSVVIPQGCEQICLEAFAGCSNLKEVTINEGVKKIYRDAFRNCSSLTSISLPSSLYYVDDKVFWGCNNLSSITLPDEITRMSELSFMKADRTPFTLYVSGACPTLINLWRYYYDDIYQAGTGRNLFRPTIVATSATSFSLSLFQTENLVYTLNKKELSGEIELITGLEPQRTMSPTIDIKLEYKGSIYKNAVYLSCTTLPLTLTTLQPKVVSSGNVIVAAESNIDDAEKNVGFEWRRTDWSDDFASNSGTAYLYEGMMEGYIRNLNTEKLWKYRPYYVSDSGTYYYGEWIGLDPTNTSYFEPTVHTYANITVDGNSASIEGLTLPGSDGVASQGFQYWESTSGANEAMMAPAHAPAIPGNAKTVEVSGQVMTTTLTGLNYGTTYNYVAFVKTTSGETFYGEVRSFTTEPGATGIYEITDGGSSAAEVHEVARYNLNGQPIDTPERGINIIRYSDGSTRKVVVK